MTCFWVFFMLQKAKGMRLKALAFDLGLYPQQIHVGGNE